MKDSVNSSIVLIDGSVLTCFPKIEHYSNKLHQSYEQLGFDLEPELYPQEVIEERKRKIEEETNLFLQNAFFFYRHSDRILTDSRMFFAHVPIKSGLGSVGSIEIPCLGVLLEFWNNANERLVKDEHGNDALTYLLAGSPFSGGNCCSRVYPDGSTASVKFDDFNAFFKLFYVINRRYSQAKYMYESYSLQEVVDILKASEISREREFETRLLIFEKHSEQKYRDWKKLESEHAYFMNMGLSLECECNRKHVELFTIEYKNRISDAEKEIENLASRKAEFKEKFDNKELSHKEYQFCIKPLSERKDEILNDLAKFKNDKLDMFAKEKHIPVTMIRSYMYDNGIDKTYL